MSRPGLEACAGYGLLFHCRACGRWICLDKLEPGTAQDAAALVRAEQEAAAQRSTGEPAGDDPNWRD